MSRWGIKAVINKGRGILINFLKESVFSLGMVSIIKSFKADIPYIMS